MADYYQTLTKIEQGNFSKRLDFIRSSNTKMSPEEIYLLLDPTKVESAAETQLSRWAHTIEGWRNGLILLPILLTWLSLGLAALAYNQTYQLHQEEPFLKRWAEGFPDASMAFLVPDFITVAIVDAGLILLLLLLTIVIQMIEGYAHKQAISIRRWLDDELFKLASTSQVHSLGTGPDNKQPAWAVEVHTAIDHLNKSLLGVEALVKSSQDTLTNLVNTSQASFQNLVKAAQEELEGSVRQFGGAIRDQREAVDEFMKGTVEVRRTVDELQRIYQEGERIYQGLNGTLPKLESSFSTMATRQDNAATALETMNTNTHQATKAVGDIAQQFIHVDLVQSTSVAAQQMHHTAQIIHNISTQMNNTVNSQIQLQMRLEQWMNYMSSTPVAPPPRKRSWFRSLFASQ